MGDQARTHDRSRDPKASASSSRIPGKPNPSYAAAIQEILRPPVVQPKVRVGEPADRYEVEADRVADRVVAGQPAPPISRMSASVQTKPVEDEKPKVQRATKQDENEPVVQRAIKDDEEPNIQREMADEGQENAETLIQRQSSTEDDEALVQRAPKDDEEPNVQREMADEDQENAETPIQRQSSTEDDKALVQRASVGSRGSPSSVATQAVTGKGAGRPMAPETRHRLESSMGVDLSTVRVHDDARARSAAQGLNARAFTHGSDIWLGSGESDSDVRLMAHESTHVVQQGGGVRGLVQRAQLSGSAAAASQAQAIKDLETLPVPKTKARHLGRYRQWAQAGLLTRPAGYDREVDGGPDQRDSVWLPGINLPRREIRRLGLATDFEGTKILTIHDREYPGTRRKLMDQLKVPNWDRNGAKPKHPLEVDHIVELQTGNWGQEETPRSNSLNNMELLKKGPNASSGSATRWGIRENVRDYLRTQQRNPQTGAMPTMGLRDTAIDDYLKSNAVNFRQVRAGRRGRAERPHQWWTRREIETGAHLREAFPERNVGEAGSAKSFALVSRSGRTLIHEYPHAESKRTISIEDETARSAVSGLELTSIQLNEDYLSTTGNAQIGTATAHRLLPEDVQGPTEMLTLPLLRKSQFSGRLGKVPIPSGLDFSPMSPLGLTSMEVEGREVVGRGQLTPSIPLLGGRPIEVTLRGDTLQFSYTYNTGELNLPIPGVQIDDVSLGVFAGTAGFGVDGGVDFSVPSLGHGSLGAQVDSSGKFEASGRFDFDSELFDEFGVEVWYRDRAFGGRGRLAITNPDKVTGIRSAAVTATFDQGHFSATGTVAPKIPGIQEGTVNVEHSEETGLSIGGRLTLSEDVPGIRSGSVDVNVRKRPDAPGYSLSATGTAQPAIPGVDATLTVAYEDGAITIEGSAAYSRGLLSGFLSLGVTNRPVDEEGNPGGDPTEQFRAYGGGLVTVQLTPWLQGMAGIRLLPNGEVEITGEIGLPDSVNVFEALTYERNIFSIDLDIPILGVAVAGQRIGIFATIGGGLDFSAGVGPGQLQDLRLGVTYNPDHEDQTHIEGSAKFVVPAHAGLRFFVRGSLGAGIPIVSASLGLEVGGRLGLEGALEAGVAVDWTPTTGLVLDAVGEIYVEPKFRFDLTGFALVEADLLFTTIELYRKRWELAAFELGSNLRLGLRLPIHYEEGQPFDLDWNAVEFDIPEVNPRQLLDGLIDQIT